MMSRPLTDWLPDEMNGLRQQQIDVVVSLLTNAEMYDLSLQEEKTHCQTHGIQFISYPIPDRNIPANVDTAVKLISTIYQLSYSGKGVIIHCRAGIGRSGLIAASVLLHEGLTTPEAFALVSKARGVGVPDTVEQKQWVEKYANKILCA